MYSDKMEPKEPIDVTNDINDEEDILDDMKIMQKMGLPSAFSANLNSGGYYCEICLVHLTNEDAYHAHLDGILHRKTVLNSKQKVSKFGAETRNPLDYLKLEEDEYEAPKVFEQENEVIHKKLVERLAETRKGFVGLEMVREINACSSRGMEPFYNCKLCEFRGFTQPILSHLLSPSHSEAYLRWKGKWDEFASVEDLVESNKENGNINTIGQVTH